VWVVSLSDGFGIVVVLRAAVATPEKRLIVQLL
jgi:hypothetical protein